MIDEICVSARAENRAAGAQLVAIGKLLAYRLSRCSDTGEWAIDTQGAVAAELAAAFADRPGTGREPIAVPAGDARAAAEGGRSLRGRGIGYLMFQTIVFRTDLIVDSDVLAAVDAELAVNVARWPSMTRGRLGAQVDKVVAKANADAVRRRTEFVAGREVWIADGVGGIAEIQRQPADPLRACAGPTVGCVGGHGMRARSA